MRRMHLFEIEDQAWCPQTIREATTDYLAGIYRLLNIYEPAYNKIAEVLNKTQEKAIVDCCSGSAGPIKKLREHLDSIGKNSVPITLTDKYPNIEAFKNLESLYPNTIIAHTNSLDASQFPSELKGMRTFFSSFHHFSPNQAVKILQDAVNNNSPIGIFECTQRHPVDFVRALMSPLSMLFIIPLAQRLNWKKFFLTYILPITPFTFMWDYLVSNMRTYSVKELYALIDQLDAPNYKWEAGKLWSKKAKCYVPYLIGYSK